MGWYWSFAIGFVVGVLVWISLAQWVVPWCVFAWDYCVIKWHQIRGLDW